MKWKQIKTSKKVPTQLPYVDLRGRPMDWAAYQKEIENIFDSKQICSEHSMDYEELTMEEKLLVDADVEFLIETEYLKTGGNLMFMSGMSRYTLEKYLARLRKRDRKNDKRK